MSIKQETTEQLQQYPSLRDDRNAAVKSVLMAMGVPETSARITAKYFREANTIYRAWREIQEKNPNLRGDEWKKRQAFSKKVSESRENLKDY